jgi:sugar/nucleoside kinase (ribokinase family)
LTDTPAIVGIGAVFIDDIVLPSGQTYMARLGGGVVHALGGVALWGARPGIVAPVGQGLPDSALERLQAHFDTRGLYSLDIPQMRAWQLFEEDGTRRELYRVREPEPFTRGAQPVNFPAVYQAASAYYLLQGFEGFRAWRAVLPGFVLWEPLQQVMTPENRAAFRAVLQTCRVDLVAPNLDEARAIYGALPPDDLVNRLFEDGARQVALRMGAAGSLVADRATGERHPIPAVQLQEMVDQTGAGNTYCGGLLWGLSVGRSLREAGAAGAVSASFCLEQIGVLDPAQIKPDERDRRYHEILKTT